MFDQIAGSDLGRPQAAFAKRRSGPWMALINPALSAKIKRAPKGPILFWGGHGMRTHVRQIGRIADLDRVAAPQGWRTGRRAINPAHRTKGFVLKIDPRRSLPPRLDMVGGSPSPPKKLTLKWGEEELAGPTEPQPAPQYFLPFSPRSANYFARAFP